jgi:hypothetical protein
MTFRLKEKRKKLKVEEKQQLHALKKQGFVLAFSFKGLPIPFPSLNKKSSCTNSQAATFQYFIYSVQ